jgi:hypothetical protein
MDTIETRSHRGIMLLLVPLMLVLFISTLDQTMATGALNFAKTLGGAFGAAVFGAILTGHLGAGAMAAFQAVFFWTVPFIGAGTAAGAGDAGAAVVR